MTCAETANRRRNEISLIGHGGPRALRWAGLLPLLGLALLVAACSRVANPQGWAPPTLADDTLYVSIERGTMAALSADTNPESGAACDDAEDSDGDGAVNEGCPRVAEKSESRSDCRNDTSDDDNGDLPDDDAVNDGCPAIVVRWVFPPDTDEGDRLNLRGVYGAPVRGDDFVYFGAYDGNIYTLDAASGDPVWAFETGDPIVNSLVLDGSTLFAGSTDGHLYAINARSGDETGRFPTGSRIWASPLIVDDVIYVATMDGRLHALNKNTLAPVEGFSFKTSSGLLMDPTLAGDETLLTGGIDSKLYALDPATGGEKWSFEGKNWFWGRPLVEGDTVYVADLDGNVYALGLDDGTLVWSFKAESSVRSAPLLAGETLLIIDRHGNAYGLDPDEGTMLWGPTPLDKTILSDPFLLQTSASPSPAAAEEGETQVLILAQGGDLCRIDPADGSPVGAFFCAEVKT